MSETTAHAEDHHHHHRFQAHHFETGEQQFQAGKLGTWLFLATEVLFFSGMFCAYAVYRMLHPEVFEFAHVFLNPTLGAANTIVLLASSLSVAWAVRCAQLNQQRGLLANLMFTLTCAGIFMGVKSVEYTLKYYEGLLWRSAFTYQEGVHPDLTKAHEDLEWFGMILLGTGAAFVVAGLILGMRSVGRRWALFAIGTAVLGAGVGCLVGNVYTERYEQQQHAHADEGHHDHTEDAHAEDAGTPHGEAEVAPESEVTEAAEAVEGAVGTSPPGALQTQQFTETPPAFDGNGAKFPGIFFSIYYAMTGVHAIHILAGIGVFVWIVSRAARLHFEPEYYGPVEYVGLYWHLVDLIWIYLFPLLYLIQ